MTLEHVNFVSVALLAGVLGATLIVVHLTLTRLKAEVAALRAELATLRDAPALPPTPEAEPQAAAAEATQSTPADEDELRQRLRQGRSDGRPPERYRQLAQLADKGLPPEEIAEVLQVSPDEARQLVKLSQVAGRQEAKKG